MNMAENTQKVYNQVSTTESGGVSSYGEPPSYFDVVSQIRAAKVDAKNAGDFARKSVSILCNSFLTNIVHVISLFLPIASLIIGIMYKEECPIKPIIPTWLIIMGAGGIANGLLNLVSNAISCVRFRVTGETTGQRVLTIVGFFLGCFLFAWLITGSVWVYSIMNQVSSDPIVTEFYCKNYCYSFAFWSITVTWIFMLIALFCVCGLFVLVLTTFCN